MIISDKILFKTISVELETIIKEVQNVEENKDPKDEVIMDLVKTMEKDKERKKILKMQK